MPPENLYSYLPLHKIQILIWKKVLPCHSTWKLRDIFTNKNISWKRSLSLINFPANADLLKGKNRNTRKRYEDMIHVQN